MLHLSTALLSAVSVVIARGTHTLFAYMSASADDCAGAAAVLRMERQRAKAQREHQVRNGPLFPLLRRS